MIRKGKRMLLAGVIFIALFALWTLLIQTVDVHPAGQTGQKVGFAALNCQIHRLTGVHIGLYCVTDWLGLVPVFVCLLFGGLGLVQLIKRKSLTKVDFDIIALGVYYVAVILCYIVFEMFPINYRPVFIEGRLEASYPSSTTLLVLSVMPTLGFQVKRRLKRAKIKRAAVAAATLFSLFMVAGRLFSGVHWFTDIVGSVLLSEGLLYLYKAVVVLRGKAEN